MKSHNSPKPILALAKTDSKASRSRRMIIVAVLVTLPLFLGNHAVDADRLGTRDALGARANPSNDWRDTGLPWIAHDQPLCFDTSRPYVVLVNEQGAGTIAYNWSANQSAKVSERYFQVCGPRGLLYQGTEGDAWRYGVADPAGRAIDHLPTHISYDGSLTVYAATNSRLWASQDGGLTWEERAAPKGWAFEGTLIVSEADAQAIYAVTYEITPSGPSATPTSSPTASATPTKLVRSLPVPTFTFPPLPTEPPTHVPGQLPKELLVFSSNGGRTWEERGPANPYPTDTTAGYTNNWGAMPGASAPVNFLLRSSFTDCCGPGAIGTEVWLSADRGRSLMRPSLGTRSPSRSIVQVVNTPLGIVRYHQDAGDNRKLDRSTDAGQTWQLLQPPNSLYLLGAARGVPGILFIETAGAAAKPGGDLIYSVNSGDTWSNVTDYTDFTVWDRTGGSYSYTPYRLDVTPYFPTTLLGMQGGRMQVLQLPADGSGLLAPALPDHNRSVLYFAETGHNVRGIFADYWASNGGLAQQGYPLTEAFEQISDGDGKVYLTQYFERAVFELHPESQSPYNVLLSLLGTQAYRQKYGPSEAPNQHASADNPLYFRETGHTIGGRFRQYWEQHGGLAQQGYPISDEFQEVSAVDGKTYTVQYFERAVFEYHPENAGTTYQVLLSPLGVAKSKELLQQVPPR